MPYHVRITPRDLRRRSHDALALDKDERWIEEQIAAPRRQGRDIFVDGQVLSWDDIDKIRITWTDETSEQLIPSIRARRRSGELAAIPVPDGWYVARNGRDVTEQFLTGPPGANPHANTGQAADFAANRKAVMVIYGHDHEAKDTLFDWLRAIGLQPCEWNQLVTASGAASPYIGQVLDSAFHQAQAVGRSSPPMSASLPPVHPPPTTTPGGSKPGPTSSSKPAWPRAPTPPAPSWSFLDSWTSLLTSPGATTYVSVLLTQPPCMIWPTACNTLGAKQT